MSATTFTLALGALYLLIGFLGFFPALTVPQRQAGQGLLFGIFAVNGLHNLVHIGIGAVLAWGALSANYGAVTRALSGVFALLVVGSLVAPIVENVAINPPDTLLHLVSVAITGFLGFTRPRPARPLAG